MSRFDKQRFALHFQAFLAKQGLRGLHFAELSGIPQYKISRIQCGIVETFDDDHRKICRFMQTAESVFFSGDEDEFVSAIERFCLVGTRRAQSLARIVAEIAALPEDGV